jgi:hypothetical protein
MRIGAVAGPRAPLPERGSQCASSVPTFRLHAVVFPRFPRYCSHMGRSAEIKVRVSPEEKAAIVAGAAAAGVGLSDFVRSRALRLDGGRVDGSNQNPSGNPRVSVPSVGRRSRSLEEASGDSSIAGSTPAGAPLAKAEVAGSNPARAASSRAAGLFERTERAFRCPMVGCPFEAGSGKARCPSHGRSVVEK